MLTGDSSLQGVLPVKRGWLHKRYVIDGIQVIAVNNHYSNYMGFFRRIVAFIGFVLFACFYGLFMKRPDIVLATSTPLTVAIPALVMKKLRSIPFVFEVRDLWPEAPIQIGAIRSPLAIALLQALERKTYREASQLVALSPGMAQGIFATGIAEDKVTLIPNCSDLELFACASIDHLPQRLEEYRNRYNLQHKLVILHGGSMGIANGLDYVIDAALLLKRQQREDIVFVLTGDGKTRPELEAACRKHALTNVVFTGSVPRKEMPLLFALADLTLTSFKNIPILATNSPNKFFDSLAAGKPVIVNSNGWTRNIVEQNQIGFYVDPTKPEELAQRLIEASEGAYDLPAMGKRARQVAEEQYERTMLAARLEHVLKQALQISAGRKKRGITHDESEKGDHSSSRVRHTFFAGDKSTTKGNAADRR